MRGLLALAILVTLTAPAQAESQSRTSAFGGAVFGRLPIEIAVTPTAHRAPTHDAIAARGPRPLRAGRPYKVSRVDSNRWQGCRTKSCTIGLAPAPPDSARRR